MVPQGNPGDGIFARFQPEYAAHGVATFPVRLDRDDDGAVVKRPAVRGYLKLGLNVSAQLAFKFPAIDALGFACGARNRLTILDIDTPDERVLADALDRHGKTPLIVRTASGKWHAYYRHNREARRIRPVPSVAIDILGAGYCIAPPSRGPVGQYEISEGKLDDLDRLPTMRNVPPPAPRKVKAVDDAEQQLVVPGTRNDALFDACRKAARDYDSESALTTFALAWNSTHCMPPDAVDNVMRTAHSVWQYEIEVMRPRRRAREMQADEIAVMSGEVDVFYLLHFLKAHNRPCNTFAVTNGLAETLGWRRHRLAQARKRLLDLGLLILVRAAYRGCPAVYRWPP